MGIAHAGLVRARWTNKILDECFDNILANRPDLKVAALARTRERMITSVPDCLIEGYEQLIAGLTLPDENDRHVLAAAIRASAQAIVTFNLKDFPADRLAAFNIEAKHPDDFILNCIDLSPARALSLLEQQVASLKDPPSTMATVLDNLRSNGLVRSVAKFMELLLPPDFS